MTEIIDGIVHFFLLISEIKLATTYHII